jgi:hypothetical protein
MPRKSACGAATVSSALRERWRSHEEDLDGEWFWRLADRYEVGFAS